MHPALQHHTRRGDRNQVRWNMACDYAINPILLDAGLTLPKDVLLDDRFRGMSAERIYNLIEEEENQEGSSEQAESKPGAGSEAGGQGASERSDCNEPQAPSTPGGVGQVLDAPAPVGEEGPPIAEQAGEWQIAVEHAESVAKLAGKLPGGVVRTLEAAQSARVDWREHFRRAWSETTPADYSWMRPNRRHVWCGLYLPGITSEGVGEIAVAVDCSGSVSNWGSSRKRSGPFWRDSAHGSCMCSTLTPQFRKSRLIRLANRFRWHQLAAEARTFGHASTGSVSGALSPRRWSFSPTFAERFPTKQRRIR
jgi:hypothetical protein